MSIPTSDDASTVYAMPFVFPFNGRNIVKLAINTNGLIELLEGGENCAECSAFSTHASGNHVTKNIDAIFALNDDLRNGVQIRAGADRVTMTWFGATWSDGDFVANPLVHQTILYDDGSYSTRPRFLSPRRLRGS